MKPVRLTPLHCLSAGVDASPSSNATATAKEIALDGMYSVATESLKCSVARREQCRTKVLFQRRLDFSLATQENRARAPWLAAALSHLRTSGVRVLSARGKTFREILPRDSVRKSRRSPSLHAISRWTPSHHGEGFLHLVSRLHGQGTFTNRTFGKRRRAGVVRGGSRRRAGRCERSRNAFVVCRFG